MHCADMAKAPTKALMIGVGGVGEAIAKMLVERDSVSLLVLAGASSGSTAVAALGRGRGGDGRTKPPRAREGAH